MDVQSSPITITPMPDGYRVVLRGPIHLNTAWIEDELKKLATAKPKLVELDMTEVGFVSSMGLSVLINFRNLLTAAGGAIKTIAIQEKVLGTVKYAYLQDLLNVTAETKIVK